MDDRTTNSISMANFTSTNDASELETKTSYTNANTIQVIDQMTKKEFKKRYIDVQQRIDFTAQFYIFARSEDEIRDINSILAAALRLQTYAHQHLPEYDIRRLGLDRLVLSIQRRLVSK